MQKEKIRQMIQDEIVERVGNGTIASQEDLESFHDDVKMALNALKGVPFDVFNAMSDKS
jgi:hypothetical protein